MKNHIALLASISLGFAASSNAATMTLVENINNNTFFGIHNFPDPNGDLQFENRFTYGSSSNSQTAPTLKFDSNLGELLSVEIKFSTTLRTDIDMFSNTNIQAGYVTTIGGWKFVPNGSEILPNQFNINKGVNQYSWNPLYEGVQDPSVLPENTTGAYTYTNVQNLMIETGVLNNQDLLDGLSSEDGVRFAPGIQLRSAFTDENGNNVITDLDPNGTNVAGTDGFVMNGWSSQEINYGANNPWEFEVTYTYDPVPEPSTTALLGLVGMGFILRRKR